MISFEPTVQSRSSAHETVLPLLVVPVIAWCLALVTHGVLEIVHYRPRPGVIASLVVLPLLITVCALIALGLWRERPDETDSL